MTSAVKIESVIDRGDSRYISYLATKVIQKTVDSVSVLEHHGAIDTNDMTTDPMILVNEKMKTSEWWNYAG